MIHSRDNWSTRGGLARLVGLLAVAAAALLAPHCADGMDPAAPVAVVAHAGSVAMTSATEPQQGEFPAGSPVQGARLAPVEAATAKIEQPHHGATGGLNALLP